MNLGIGRLLANSVLSDQPFADLPRRPYRVVYATALSGQVRVPPYTTEVLVKLSLSLEQTSMPWVQRNCGRAIVYRVDVILSRHACVLCHELHTQVMCLMDGRTKSVEAGTVAMLLPILPNGEAC